ncbi:MAG: endonuclease domain-containing protein [Anaerolineales bacterium]
MPPRRANPKGYERARQLRKELTPAEQKLWAYLRNNKLNGVNFRRQHAIGRFIVDFVSIKKKLVIELDGSQHLKQEEQDTERTQYLESQGYKVIRFWNDKVTNDIDGVINTIDIALDQE